MATEKRLIDANEFLTEVVKLQALLPEQAVAKIILLLSDMNGVDTVPVVRCKDCVRGELYSKRPCYIFCMEHHRLVEKEDFCSYGERKDKVIVDHLEETDLGDCGFGGNGR